MGIRSPSRLSRRPRFIAHSELERGTTIQLSDRDSHHASAVLRLQPGDAVEVISEPIGSIFEGTVAHLGPPVSVCVREAIARASDGPRIHLFLGSIKPALEELVVEKAVELGITAITLFAGARSNRAPGADRVAPRLERLSRIAEAAMKQSGTGRRPRIAFFPSLAATFAANEPSIRCGIVCVAPSGADGSRGEATDIKDYLSAVPGTFDELTEARTQSLEVIAEDVDFHILIGPEGGFSSEELALARTYRFHAVSLGSSVLRAETAAVVACGILRLMCP